MERMKILSNKKYDRLIIEIETLKEIRENDEMCINMMADRINRLEEENKKLKEELSKKSMEIWFDKKAENIFIDKSGKVIKGGEFTTLC